MACCVWTTGLSLAALYSSIATACAGEVSDNTGARASLSSPPAAEWLLGGRGFDADWFREALINKKITPCIPGDTSRDKPIKYDKDRYRKRNRIDIMFGRLKDRRRMATRYDRIPKVFLLRNRSRCDRDLLVMRQEPW
jgi:transposase